MLYVRIRHATAAVASHRPSNVDDERRFSEIAAVLALWEGRAAERVVDALDRFLEQRRAATA